MIRYPHTLYPHRVYAKCGNLDRLPPVAPGYIDLMPRPRRPDPEPLRTNDVLVACVGTVAWAIALVVLLAIGLAPADRWWLWVCAGGITGGLFGIWYIPRLQRKRARRAQRS
jgi:hypothetical protein